MEIQPLTHSDIPSISALLPMGWEDALPIIETYTAADHCSPIKVEADNSIVGTGTVIIHAETAWLAHIIVHPAHRGQGLGKAITDTLVKTARTHGCETIYLLATELGGPVYERAGFETETEYLVFRCDGVHGPFTDSEHIVPITEPYHQQVLHLDSQATGEDRVRVLGPHLAVGFIYLIGNEVQGFHLPTLGHGPVIAITAEAGKELMKLRLRSMDFVSFPKDNAIAMAFMQQHGFSETRREKRMRFGKKRAWHPEHVFAIVGGNLG